MYKIKYNYDSGDSFSIQEGLEDYLEIEWKNIEIAKANLKRIEEHYKQYCELNSYNRFNSNSKSREQILYENRNKDWFVKDKSSDISECCIILYTDEGNSFQFWAPWCGYFERLNFVELKVKDYKIKF